MTERDRDPDGKPKNARPRDALGRPLPYDETGVEPVPEDLDLSPNEAITEAQRLFDHGYPFHAHEVFEGSWKSAPLEERTLWQGLAQLAVGLTHLLRGNPSGAASLLRQGQARVRHYEDAPPHGLDIDGLSSWADHLLTEIDRGDPIPDPPFRACGCHDAVMPILPMFPLGTALLPGDHLPLRVFEPRYQQLVHDCMAAPDGPRFGVVLIARGHEVGGGDIRHGVGTVARIVVDTELGGGHHRLECLAEERIRILQWLPDDPYPRAEVEPWPDTPSEGTDLSGLTGLFGKLYGLLDRLTENGVTPPRADDLPDEPGARLYALSRWVPMGDADKLALLSAPGPDERLAVLTEAIATAIDVAEWRLKEH